MPTGRNTRLPFIAMSPLAIPQCPQCGAQVALGDAEHVRCPYCGAEVRRASPTARQLLGQLGMRVADPAQRAEYEARVRLARQQDEQRRRLAVVLAVAGMVFALVAIVASQIWWRSRR